MQITKTNSNRLVQMILDIFLGYVLTFIFIIVYSIILTYTNVNDTYIVFVTLLATIISVVYVGYRFARNAESGGMLWGIFGGVFYSLIFIIFGFLVSDTYNFDKKLALVLVFSVIAGALGGIIGINSKK